jgi:2-polyprenyl-3-methyl-5-hydroxy-6-metoxy-1,4-benzoquinol methylase
MPTTAEESLNRLLTQMEKSARFARASVRRAVAEFGTGWETDFTELLANLYGSDSALEEAVKGYGAFVMDSMRRQKRFDQELRYPAKTYAEVACEVYHNAEYMRRQYLPGLLLSHYLWAHHYRQIEYFKAFFLPWLLRQRVKEFAEVGVGTGMYSRIALQHMPQLHGTGLDISSVSLDFTGAHIASFGLAPRYTLRQQDILAESSGPSYRAVICVEVLEHLEDPVAFLAGLKRLTAPDGRLFVTAALNAAHADHIFLYRKPEEVLVQAEAAGLNVEHCFFAPAYAPATPGQPVPGALALVLTPRG